ncbi:MAG: prepilin-type N-terminal cleavage/methylation domain-containing protein [Planctomycetota bacterium]
MQLALRPISTIRKNRVLDAPLASYSLRATPSRRGFTIVEILAVVFIITIVLGVTFPIVSAFRDGSKTSSGITTISTAVDVTRAYATNEIRPDLSKSAIPVLNATYSGTAAIFTPAGQVRITINNQAAEDTAGTRIESIVPAQEEAYADHPNLDFVTLTSGTGVVGVARNAAGLLLYPPPFAITFNAEGVMITEPDTIIYDSNGDRDYDTGSARPNPYVPADWDRANRPITDFGTAGIKRELPFERLEVVTAVVVFDLDAFYDEFPNTQTTNWPEDNAAINNWILENGRPLIFSRATGVAFQDEGDGN